MDTVFQGGEGSLAGRLAGTNSFYTLKSEHLAQNNAHKMDGGGSIHFALCKSSLNNPTVIQTNYNAQYKYNKYNKLSKQNEAMVSLRDPERSGQFQRRH